MELRAGRDAETERARESWLQSRQQETHQRGRPSRPSRLEVEALELCPGGEGAVEVAHERRRLDDGVYRRQRHLATRTPTKEARAAALPA
eukprot:6181247-Pleurochrysis_carterae.AAC.3